MIIWGHGRRRATVGVSWPGRGDAIRERSAQVGPLPVVHHSQRSAARRGSFLRDVWSPLTRRAVALSASGQFCGYFRTSHALVSREGESPPGLELLAPRPLAAIGGVARPSAHGVRTDGVREDP